MIQLKEQPLSEHSLTAIMYHSFDDELISEYPLNKIESFIVLESFPYENPELIKKINHNRRSTIELNEQKLTDNDMLIVVTYDIIEKKVKNFVYHRMKLHPKAFGS